ncbi:MAG: DUF2062 domain-containing protein [Chloroflexota bacterium]
MLKQTAMVKVQEVYAELRVQWLEMVRADAPALALAAAFAIGTLVSMVPVPVVDMMLAALVMRLIHRMPRGPVVAAMALWNSFIMAPVYASSPKVGGLLITTAIPQQPSSSNAILPRIIVGNLAIAVGLALCSFLAAATLFSALRLQHRVIQVQG